MKRQRFSRKQILLAIKAALLAIFLASGRAEAQFVYNGQAPADQLNVKSAHGTGNMLTGSGTFFGYFHDFGSGRNDISIDGRAHITSSSPVIAFGLKGDSGGGIVTNEGTLSEISRVLGNTVATVDIGTGFSSLKFTSGGAITASGSGPFEGGPVRGIEATALGTGAISITNRGSGTITASGYYLSTAVSATGNGGAVEIENDGNISGSGNYTGVADGIGATNNGGDIAITNGNTLSASGYGYYNGATGVSAAVSQRGSITINNFGSLTSSAAGFYSTATGITASSGTGNITALNTGSVTASGYLAVALVASSGGSFTLTNSGSLYTEGSYEGQEGFGPSGPALGAGAYAVGNISISNSGSITGSASSYAPDDAYGIQAHSSGGTISIDNSNGVSSSDYLFGNTYGIGATNNGAGIIIRNSGAVSSSAAVGIARGIDVETAGANTFGVESKIINTGNIAAFSNFSTVAGIEVVTSGSSTEVANGVDSFIRASGPPATTYGIQIQGTVGKDVIANEGSIDSSGVGIQDLGTGNITVDEKRGSITSGSGSKSIVLGSGRNTVNIIGESTITGLIDGGTAHVANTLSFSDIETTSAQRAAFQTVCAQAAADPTGVYSVTLGSETYTFTDFNIVKGTPSQE